MSRLKKNIKSSPMSEINVVPYIDVMLVLLIVFMITAPILTQGIAVDLPKAASKTLKQSDKEPLIVSVDRQGRLFLNLAKSPELPIDVNTLLLRAAAEITLAKEQGEALQVLVKADQGVAYGKVVEAMSLLKKAGAEKVGLLTDNLTESRGHIG